MLVGKGFEIPFPEPTHAKQPSPESKLNRWLTLKEAIGKRAVPVTLKQARTDGGPLKHRWHVVRDLQSQVAERLAAAIPGKTWLALDEKFRPDCHKGNYTGFTNVYGRMAWAQTPVTMTGGCTTPCKGRFGHPEKDRTTISVLEAALIQTFPEDYNFVTEEMEAVCKMIGNAVPPDFARIAGERIRKTLRSRHEQMARR
jgi:DNA (cytosine-5)-methyltransferase 1